MAFFYIFLSRFAPSRLTFAKQTDMKKNANLASLLLICLLFVADSVLAQCSICTRTAEQLGEKPAEGLNAGILYLAFTPLAIIGFIAYTWWKKEKSANV